MGSANSSSNFGYGKVAAFQWYLEGSRKYGRSGYEAKCGNKRASWYPTPCKATLAPFYFGLWEAAARLAHSSTKRLGVGHSHGHHDTADDASAPKDAFVGSEDSEEKMKATMTSLIEEAIQTHTASLTNTYRKRVLITGSNRGLGFTSALSLARLGAEVHLACRSIGRGNEAKAKIIDALKEDLSKVASTYLGHRPQQQEVGSSFDFITHYYPQPECRMLQRQIEFFIYRGTSTPAAGAEEFVSGLLSKDNFVNRLAPLLDSLVVVHECDCGDFGSVRRFSELFIRAHGRLDVLIHNAGVMLDKYTYAIDSSKVMSVSRDDTSNTSETSELSIAPPPDACKEATMATMAGGSVLMTELLLPALAAAYDVSKEAAKDMTGSGGDAPANKYLAAEHGARVINVASGGLFSVGSPEGDIQFTACAPDGGPNCIASLAEEGGDTKSSGPRHPFDGTLLYAYTKRAQVILTEMWPLKLKARLEELGGGSEYDGYRAISFHTTHPGWVATGGVETSMPEFYAKNKDNLRTEMQGSDTVAFLASVGGSQVVDLHASFEKAHGTDGVPVPILPLMKDNTTPGEQEMLLSQGQFWFDREPVSKHKTLGRTRSSKESDERLWSQCREFCDLSSTIFLKR